MLSYSMVHTTYDNINKIGLAYCMPKLISHWAMELIQQGTPDNMLTYAILGNKYYAVRTIYPHDFIRYSVCHTGN